MSDPARVAKLGPSGARVTAVAPPVRRGLEMQNLNCDVAAGLPAITRPPGAGSAPPVALPVWPGRRFVDLVANSLRDVARRDCDAMYQLMANAIVQHLAADVQGVTPPPGGRGDGRCAEPRFDGPAAPGRQFEEWAGRVSDHFMG